MYRLSMVTWGMEVRVWLVVRQIVLLMVRLGDNGVMTATMLMEMVNIVDHRRQEAVVAMLGRVMDQPRDLFTALRWLC